MTLGQLESFLTVARLGSVKAAAVALGVSEPSVSGAVAALRRDLGDELFVRGGGGIELTAGGRRLAAAAAETLGVMDQARREIRAARGERGLLRVAATSVVAESVAGSLIAAFTRRSPNLDVALGVEPEERLAQALLDRRADVALGPRPGPAPSGVVDAVAFLRYRLVVVAAPGHRLVGRRDVALGALVGERWLVGAAGAGSHTDVGRLLGRAGVAPTDVRAFPSEAAALDAAVGGLGVMLAVSHVAGEQLRRGTLVRLDVRGTPAEGLWHASTLAADRSTAAAAALRRFVTTPDATQAMLARGGGVPAERVRPSVYVTLWS
jgi:LysR family transcriptional regulator, low CO2-responsive transcriptional regulator